MRGADIVNLCGSNRLVVAAAGAVQPGRGGPGGGPICPFAAKPGKPAKRLQTARRPTPKTTPRNTHAAGTLCMRTTLSYQVSGSCHPQDQQHPLPSAVGSIDAYNMPVYSKWHKQPLLPAGAAQVACIGRCTTRRASVHVLSTRGGSSSTVNTINRRPARRHNPSPGPDQVTAT